MRFIEEVSDEIGRYKRDKKLNMEKHQVLNPETFKFETTRSENIKVGDIIKINNQRVPADLIILGSK